MGARETWVKKVAVQVHSENDGATLLRKGPQAVDKWFTWEPEVIRRAWQAWADVDKILSTGRRLIVSAVMTDEGVKLDLRRKNVRGPERL